MKPFQYLERHVDCFDIRQALPGNKFYNTLRKVNLRRAQGSDNITLQKWFLPRRLAIVFASITNIGSMSNAFKKVHTHLDGISLTLKIL